MQTMGIVFCKQWGAALQTSQLQYFEKGMSNLINKGINKLQ